MKKIVTLLGFFLILFISIKSDFVFAAGQAVIPQCLTITGKFNATDWKSGTMDVGCDGDNGKFCHGQIAHVKPGKTFTLTKCSCPHFANGCLKISKSLVIKNDGPNNRPRVHPVGATVPNKCTLTRSSNKCGTNGQAISINFKVACKVTVTLTPTPPITVTPTPRITETPTPTICVGPKVVTNVKVTCPNCINTPTPTEPITIDENTTQ